MTDATTQTTQTETAAPKRNRSTPAAMVVDHIAAAVKGAKSILEKEGLPDDIKATLTGIAALNAESPEMGKLAAFRLSSIRANRPGGPPLEAGDSVCFADEESATLYGTDTKTDYKVESVKSVGGNEEGKGSRYWATITTPRGPLPVPASLLTLLDGSEPEVKS